MNQYIYKDFTIEVFDDANFDLTTIDSTKYSKRHFGTDASQYPVSKHGIRVFRGLHEISNCLVIGSAGATGIFSYSSLLDDSQLLLCCCNTVFCFSLPTLTLKWQVEPDYACCFQILRLQNSYLVHGEMRITRLSREGKIEWEFMGDDIFVTIDGVNPCEIVEDRILLTDFIGTKYMLDFEGKIIGS